MMNTEPHVEVIAGTMFSGKSTELIRRMNRYTVIGKKIQVFKPAMDDRYSKMDVVSHDGMKREVIPVSNLERVLELLKPDTEIIGVDEAQFFDSGMVKLCDDYANRGGIAIVSVLLKDFQDRFFKFRDGKGDVSRLLEIADYVSFLNALCKYEGGNGQICGQEAARVQRLIDSKVAPLDSPLVMVGGVEAYSPRCRKHFQFYES